MDQPHTRYRIDLTAGASDGLVLWESSGMTLLADYLLVALQDGHVHFAFNLGKQQAFTSVKCDEFVADMLPHTILVER
jgi:hypothetical protein